MRKFLYNLNTKLKEQPLNILLFIIILIIISKLV
jgi:hypothetical protein